MSTTIQRRDSTAPPPLDEGYWTALLQEGEYAAAAPSDFEAFTTDYHTELKAPEAAHELNNVTHYETTENYEPDWRDIEQIMKNDEVTELNVVGYNRGGLLVEWRSLHGFVPASQLTDFPATGSETERRNAMLDMVGKHLTLRVIELNAEQNRLILSERAARVRAGERADILNVGGFSDQVFNLIAEFAGVHVPFAAQRADSLKATINHPSFDLCYSSTLLALRRSSTTVQLQPSLEVSPLLRKMSALCTNFITSETNFNARASGWTRW